MGWAADGPCTLLVFLCPGLSSCITWDRGPVAGCAAGQSREEVCAGKQPGGVGPGAREVSSESSEMLYFLPLGSNQSFLRDPRIQRTETVPRTKALTELGGQGRGSHRTQSKTGRWQKR